MRASYKLLKEYVDFDYSPDELAKKLTMQGIEVERVSEYGPSSIDLGVVVAKIRSITPHPNADKLSLCDVFDGKDEFSIVCGAANIKSGDNVCLARIGSSVSFGEIKETTIRGVKSFGMLCSRFELGFEDGKDGVWILPSSFTLGKSINEYLSDIRDYIFDITLTANRGDCLSLLGLAREIAAMSLGFALHFPNVEVDCDKSVLPADVLIKEPSFCSRYSSRIIKDIRVEESPLWLKEALIKLGARPINNIVDITNFVLFELGHPLHAFDLDRLSNGHRLCVGKAIDGEVFSGIDDKDRELSSSMFVISDYKKTVALAGVMGGSNSAVSNGTTSILLESAFFNPSFVRSTSKTLSIVSESSYRFERGVDIDNVTKALDRCTYLIQKICSSSRISDITDVYPHSFPKKELSLSLPFINIRLGTMLTKEQVKQFLLLLGFSVEDKEDDTLFCVVPSFRVDVEREIDIVEEIARIYSYNNIEEQLPLIKPVGLGSSFLDDEAMVKNILVGLGLTESINYSFCDTDKIDKLNYNKDNMIRIINPLANDSELLRDSLFPSLLNTVIYNAKHNASSISIFEMGNVFCVNDDSIETKKLACALYGNSDDKSVYTKERLFDFFDLKGMIEALFSKLGVSSSPQFKVLDKLSFYTYLHPFKSAFIMYEDKELGYIGECHPKVYNFFKLSHPLIFCELDFAYLLNISSKARQYKNISRFPFVPRDLAILVDANLPSRLVMDTIRASSNLLVDIVLVDIYEGEQIPRANKSLAFSLHFQSDTCTLLDEVVNKEYDYIVSVLRKEYGGKMRAF